MLPLAWSGTNEDPVTGGTNTFLAKEWSERIHTANINSFQRSEKTRFEGELKT